MRIFETPIRIKNLELRNRLVMPPMATAQSGMDGQVTEQLCNYYDEKSRGGYIGLIITEHSFISPEGRASKGQLSIANDGDVAGLSRLTGTIHTNGAKVMAQLNHAGGAASEKITGYAPLGASSVRLPRMPAVEPAPREMTLPEIDKVISDFAQAAQRAKKAGFDGVEIHSAHGYLLNQFFSPLTNQRTDRYGGKTIGGRIRLHLEIIEAIRAAAGKDYPLALRLGACDYMDGGTTIEDSVLSAKEFEKAGVDLLDISGGLCSYIRPGVTEQGYFSEISEAVKRSVSVPVLLTGGIVDAAAAEKLLAENKADLIGVGRAMLKNSEWAKNANLLEKHAIMTGADSGIGHETAK